MIAIYKKLTYMKPQRNQIKRLVVRGPPFSMEYDCNMFSKHLVFQMKNLVFQPKYLVFPSKTLDFERNTRYFESEILKY